MRVRLLPTVRRNPAVAFVTDPMAFLRTTSAAWAEGDGTLRLIPEGREHSTFVDWQKVEQMGGPTEDEAWAFGDEHSLSADAAVLDRLHWVAIGSILQGRTSQPADRRAMEALALFLASAVLHFARQRASLLEQDFILYDTNHPFDRGAHINIGDLISRHAAQGVEEAMYDQLSRLPTPTHPVNIFGTPTKRRK
jgi:hypothetical protein